MILHRATSSHSRIGSPLSLDAAAPSSLLIHQIRRGLRFGAISTNWCDYPTESGSKYRLRNPVPSVTRQVSSRGRTLGEQLDGGVRLNTPKEEEICSGAMGETEELKSKSRRDDSERKDESKRSRDRGRDRDRDKDRERNGEKERHRHRDKDKDRESRRSEKERSVDDKPRDREKHKDKRREREKDKEKERRKDREDKDEEREDREKEREREQEREREREREKERVRKERERRERREREKEKERERRRREVESDDSSSDDDRRDRDRKRRRKDHEHRERDHERSGKSSRHRDGSVDNQKKASVEESDRSLKKASTREEDMEEEQRKLDEEMEKRRRRVQEWQELKRKKEEDEKQNHGEENAEEPKAGKTWTLDGESDDEEAAPAEISETDMDEDGAPKTTAEAVEGMAIDSQNGTAAQNAGAAPADDEEIDPLDAFMNTIMPEVEQLTNASLASNTTAYQVVDLKSEGKKDKLSNGGVSSKKGSKKGMGRILPEDDESDYEEYENDEPNLEEENDDEFMKRVKKTKVEKLAIVDHSKIDYPPFRKNFHIEVREIAKMTLEEVSAYRKLLELKVHGKDVPKPVKTWHQTGLSTKILDTIKKMQFEKPMPIQSQALPVIMSGRDCIGIAKTGSGKTLAFVLPMLRHIKDQAPLMSGDGPIGLIMAPTRELVQQIHTDIRRFAKVVGLTCVPVYGGSGVAQQISELKRGAEIVVCTPGRMIDILCTSGGKITNLRRVTYLVMDEADRMFDMGFEPQITRIVQNTRPDRQTVLFSATFPRQVEILARKVLINPVEMQVGGRSVVNKDITQMVEMRPENERFLRLLEILGEWYEKGKILIFVHSQEKCDSLFNDLLKKGHACLSLHGGKDQTDRESTLSDFKSNVCSILIATSVAARGLDVKELDLVINYDVPNHYEDYVHRVGRTGRAGRKGMAITFISEEEARYAPDLLKALELSEQPIPDDLKALSNGFMAKVKEGVEKAHGTGYGGSGFKFNEEEDEVRKAAKKAQAKEYGFEEDRSDSEDEDDGIRKAGGGDISQATTLAQVAALAKANAAALMQQQPASTPAPVLPNATLLGGIIPTLPGSIPASGPAEVQAKAMAAAFNLQQHLMKLQAEAMPEHYEAELEINDFPQNARWKVTHKETLGPISEWTGAAITTRGMHFPPGKIAGPGDRKLYLYIEGPTEQSVKRAKAELKRVLEDITMQATSLPGSAQPGRYSVL